MERRCRESRPLFHASKVPAWTSQALQAPSLLLLLLVVGEGAWFCRCKQVFVWFTGYNRVCDNDNTPKAPDTEYTVRECV